MRRGNGLESVTVFCFSKNCTSREIYFFLFSTTNKTLLLDFCTLDMKRGGGESVTVLCCSKNCTPRGNIFFISAITNTTLLLDFFHDRYEGRGEGVSQSHYCVASKTAHPEEIYFSFLYQQQTGLD